MCAPSEHIVSSPSFVIATQKELASDQRFWRSSRATPMQFSIRSWTSYITLVLHLTSSDCVGALFMIEQVFYCLILWNRNTLEYIFFKAELGLNSSLALFAHAPYGWGLSLLVVTGTFSIFDVWSEYANTDGYYLCFSSSVCNIFLLAQAWRMEFCFVQLE